MKIIRMVLYPGIKNVVRGLLFCLTTFLLFQGSTSAQVHWTHFEDASVLSPGPEGSWDAGIAFLPAVIKNGDTLKMWYTGSGETI